MVSESVPKVGKLSGAGSDGEVHEYFVFMVSERREKRDAERMSCPYGWRGRGQIA
jgi:hypothetical protein